MSRNSTISRLLRWRFPELPYSGRTYNAAVFAFVGIIVADWSYGGSTEKYIIKLAHADDPKRRQDFLFLIEHNMLTDGEHFIYGSFRAEKMTFLADRGFLPTILPSKIEVAQAIESVAQ